MAVSTSKHFRSMEEFRVAFLQTHGEEPDACDYPAYLHVAGKSERPEAPEEAPSSNPDVFQREPARDASYFTHLTLRDLFALAYASGGKSPETCYVRADDALKAREGKKR